LERGSLSVFFLFIPCRCGDCFFVFLPVGAVFLSPFVEVCSARENAPLLLFPHRHLFFSFLSLRVKDLLKLLLAPGRRIFLFYFFVTNG